MKRDRKIPGYRGNYYVYRIESQDTYQIEQECKGFIHGGKMMYLPRILSGMGCGLKSSNMLRQGGERFRSRDTSKVVPDGEGVYFRFIPQNETIKHLLTTGTGPGASGGFFFCMRVRDAVDLTFYTMNSNDVKYSLVNSKDARENQWDESGELVEKMCRIASAVESQASGKNGINNSEIAFYQEVPLSKIGEVFLLKSSTDSSKMWSVDRTVYERTYQDVYGAAPPRRSVSQPIRRAEVISLFGELLNRQGFIYEEDVEIKIRQRKDVYLRYIKASQRLFELRASASGISGSSEPASASTPSDGADRR